jgi:hypothetical protein
MIRNPATLKHHKAVLKGLLGPLEADLRAAVGFTADNVLACFMAIPEIHEDGRLRLRSDAKSNDDSVGNVSQRFGDYFAFTAKDFVTKARVTVDVVSQILDAFSLKFGEVTEHVLLPSPFSVLRQKPLLSLGEGRFIVTNPSLLLPSIQMRIEDLINPGVTGGAASGLWGRYERHRGQWLEEEALRLVERMMPGGAGCIGTYYLVNAKQVEGDVLYQIDDLACRSRGKGGGNYSRNVSRRSRQHLARHSRDYSNRAQSD